MLTFELIRYARSCGFNIDFFIDYLNSANELIIEEFLIDSNSIDDINIFDIRGNFKLTEKNSFIHYCKFNEIDPYQNETLLSIKGSSLVIESDYSSFKLLKFDNHYLIKTTNLIKYDDVELSEKSFLIEKDNPYYAELSMFSIDLKDDYIKIFDINTSCVNSLYFEQSDKGLNLVVSKDFEVDDDYSNSLIKITKNSRFFKAVDAFHKGVMAKEENRVLQLKRR